MPPVPCANDVLFYGHAWALHLSRMLADVAATRATELLVVGASVGTRRRLAASRGAIAEAITATGVDVEYRVAS